MNTEEFIQIVESADDEVLSALLDGKAIKLVDDERLIAGSTGAMHIIVRPGLFDFSSPENIRELLIEHAKELVFEYYRVNPLSQPGFDKQLFKLIESLGHASFASESGTYPQKTVFVEVGDVVAEGVESPRHKYGSFCEIAKGLDENAVVNTVERWINSGEAYRQYISSNVCRYNC